MESWSPLDSSEVVWDAPPEAGTGPTPDGVTWDEDKYGGVTGMLKSGALGALRGATLSGSDLALTSTGLMKPEDLEGYQRTNPVSSVGGEIAGAVGSSFIDPLAPAALIGKAGKAAVGAIKGIEAVKAIDRASTVGHLLGAAADIGATAIGGAIEGSLYTGIGSSINEYALGDPGLNGEKVASNFGMGALMGGALSGLLKSAEIVVPESVTAAKDAVASVRNKLFGSGEGESSLLSSTVRQAGNEKIANAIENRAINLDKDQRTSIIKDITDNLSTVDKNTETSLKKLNQVIRPAERDALIETAAPLETVRAERQGVIDHMNQALKQAEERPALYDPGPVAKLEQLRDDLVGQLGENRSASEIHTQLIESKQQLDKLSYTKMSSTLGDTKDLINGVSGKIRELVHNPDVFGLAGAAQGEHDSVLARQFEFTPPGNKATPFRKAFMEKDGKGNWQMSSSKIELALKQKGTPKGDVKLELLNNWWDHIQSLPEHLESTFQHVPNDLWDESKFSKMSDILKKSKQSVSEGAEKYTDAVANMKGRKPGMGEYAAATLAMSHPAIAAAAEVFNLAMHPHETINKLAAIESLIGKSTKMISQGSRAIFDSSVKGIDLSKSVISRHSSEDELKKQQTMQRKFAEYQADPAKLANELGNATDRLHRVAPNISQNLQISTAKAVQFLSSKNPVRPDSNPFQKAYEPSLSEMAKYHRYAQIVEKPTIALEQVKSNTLVPETMETLKTVYPKLLDQMRQAVSLEASKHVKKNPIPYQLKMSLSEFLGTPIDQSLTPQNILANQGAFITQGAQGGKKQTGTSQFKDLDIAQGFKLNPNDED